MRVNDILFNDGAVNVLDVLQYMYTNPKSSCMTKYEGNVSLFEGVIEFLSMNGERISWSNKECLFNREWALGFNGSYSVFELNNRNYWHIINNDTREEWIIAELSIDAVITKCFLRRGAATTPKAKAGWATPIPGSLSMIGTLIGVWMVWIASIPSNMLDPSFTAWGAILIVLTLIFTISYNIGKRGIVEGIAITLLEAVISVFVLGVAVLFVSGRSRNNRNSTVRY